MARIARSHAVALALVEHPKVALAVLVASLAVADDVRVAVAGESPLHVDVFAQESIEGCRVPARDIDGVLPQAQVRARRKVIADAGGGKASGTEILAATLALPQKALLKMLAAFIGRRYDVMHDGVGHSAAMNKRSRYAMAKAIEEALHFDMADWWEPDEEHFFSRVSKGKILEAVTEACGPEAAKALASMKKDAAAKKAAELLKGKRWLPSPLRLYEIAEGAAAVAADADADGEADDEADED